jgi:hypothetical protein
VHKTLYNDCTGTCIKKSALDTAAASTAATTQLPPPLFYTRPQLQGIKSLPVKGVCTGGKFHGKTATVTIGMGSFSAGAAPFVATQLVNGASSEELSGIELSVRYSNIAAPEEPITH